MKAKWIGLLLLLVVALGAAGYVWLTNAQQVSEIQGYVGGEKIGLLEDAEVQEILRERYKLSMDYTRAGSIEMVTMDAEGQNYLFPSNQTALELYTHNAVAEALKRQGIAQESGGVTTVDMAGLTQLIESGAEWADIGLPELYGTVSVGTTDPAKSNSGNMFAGLLANTLAGGVAAEEDLPEVLPRLQEIVERLGYMESSSSDLFDQFLKTGMGAKPLIAGYESQLLEFAVQEPEVWSQIQEDIVMLYPTPTVWSSHVYIALDSLGAQGAQALLDEDIQRIAWEKHGFRTGVYDAPTDIGQFGVDGVAQEVTQVVSMPSAAVMDQIIQALS